MTLALLSAGLQTSIHLQGFQLPSSALMGLVSPQRCVVPDRLPFVDSTRSLATQASSYRRPG